MQASVRPSNWIAMVTASGLVALTGLAAVAGPGTPTATPSPESVELFEKKVRPLLSAQCFGCHTGASARGKLDLTSREKLLRGGELGPALVPGSPEKSLLLQALRYTGELKMPPKGRLPDSDLAAVAAWIQGGAPWPGSKPPLTPPILGGNRNPAPNPQSAIPNPQSHWSFQPLRPPVLPAVKDRSWVKSPIDAFVLAKLEAAGLRPNPPADPRTLIRRVTYDLTGLPPTPEEVEAFLRDCEAESLPAEHAEARGRGGRYSGSQVVRYSGLVPQSEKSAQSADSPVTPSASFRVFRGQVPEAAYIRLVERLLASPRYGERWGRHWLDVARYSDSNGLDWNEVFPNAWRYRDWVVKSFNEDKPYHQFAREQLAGDLLPAASDAERYDHLVATGFLVMGPKLLAQQDRKQLAMDVVDEQIDVTSKAFLGLTASCARCHDHKFDPIPTRDYYALAGIFKSTVTLSGTLPRNDRVMYWSERPLAPQDRVAARKAFDDEVKKLDAEIKKTKDAAEKTRLQAQLKELQAKAPPVVPSAMAVAEGKVADCPVHIRGQHQHLGPEVPRGVLTQVGAPACGAIPPAESGRRELAEWIVSPQNPLTPRVIVNRVWQHHFGLGIVPTPDNFGAQGEPPSHRELLDYLAFVFTQPAASSGNEWENGRKGEWGKPSAPGVSHSPIPPLPHSASPEGLGWSLKRLHRLILLSSTYRESSDIPSAPSAKSADASPLASLSRVSRAIPQSRDPQSIDPENRLLWRANRQRLEAEAIRDSMLAAAGTLDLTAGGTLLQKASGFPAKEFPVDYSVPRRSVYMPSIRVVTYDMLKAFDFAEPSIVMGRRNTTTVATQALVLLNSPFVLQQSRQFARDLLAHPMAGDEKRVELAYQRALGRSPSSGETARVLAYLDAYENDLRATEPDAEKRRTEVWGSFCQTLFACSEFRYVN